MIARISVLAALLVAGVPLRARAAPPNRFAVVIGVNGPDHGDLPRLRYADDDAVAMHALLTEAGVQSVLYTSLDDDTQRRNPGVHPSGRATWTAIEAAFAALERPLRAAADAGNDPELYIFFSGHGDVSQGEGYVVLEDGRLTRSRLRTLLERTKIARQHVVIDACRSYYLAFEKGGPGKRSKLDRRIVEDERGLPDRVGFILSTSSDRESHEWDRFQGGVFSYEVRSALRGAADANGDGVITYAELGAFLTIANQGIANERFRPDFLLSPPAGSRRLLQAPLLTWPVTSPALTADELAHHFYVEDARGTRLLDANPGRDQRLIVHLPADPPLFVRAGEPEEIVLSQVSGRISDGQRQPTSVASKGALHLALEQLFATPFGGQNVADFERTWTPPRPAELDREPPASLRRAAGWTFVGTASLGVVLQLVALERYETALHSSQLERHARNQTIERLDLAAFIAYGVAGVAGATWVTATLWHDREGRSVDVGIDGGGAMVSGRF
jgi:hypothetical protein